MTVAEQWRTQGMQQGMLQGKEETARNLLNMGLSIEEVQQATGLDINTIRKLQKKL